MRARDRQRERGSFRAGHLTLVERYRLSETVEEPDARFPSDVAPDAVDARHEVAGLDPLRQRRPGVELDAAAACNFNNGVRHVDDGSADAAADVVDAADRGGRGAKLQQRIGRIVDVEVIALLRAIAVNRERLSGQRQMNQVVHDTVGGPTTRLPWTIWIRETSDGVLQTVGTAIDSQVLFRRKFVDRVDAEWIGVLLFANRCRTGFSIRQPRADEDERRLWTFEAQRLEQHQVAATIDVEVGRRIVHAAHRARLPGQVEHDVLPGDSTAHRGDIAQVAFDHMHAGGGEVRGG